MPTEIWIAIIAAVPLTLTAIAGLIQTVRVNKKIGQGDDGQTVMDILRDVIGWQAAHDLRHEFLEAGIEPQWNLGPAYSVKDGSGQSTDSTSTARPAARD